MNLIISSTRFIRCLKIVNKFGAALKEVIEGQRLKKKVSKAVRGKSRKLSQNENVNE